MSESIPKKRNSYLTEVYCKKCDKLLGYNKRLRYCKGCSPFGKRVRHCRDCKKLLNSKEYRVYCFKCAEKYPVTWISLKEEHVEVPEEIQLLFTISKGDTLQGLKRKLIVMLWDYFNSVKATSEFLEISTVTVVKFLEQERGRTKFWLK